MKKKYYLFLLFTISIFSQNNQPIDSVLNKFQTLKETNPDKALVALKEGFKSAQEPDKLKKQATYLVKMIHISGLKHDLKEALENYNIALQFAKENKINGQIISSNTEFGEANRKSNELEVALKYFSKANEIAKDLNDKKGLISSFNNISIVYNQKGDFKNALKNLLRAYKLSDENNLLEQTILTGNIANLYNKTNNKIKSEEYARKGIFFGLKNKDYPEMVVSSFVGLVNNLHDRKALPEAQKTIDELEKHIRKHKLKNYEFYLLELKVSQLILSDKPKEAKPIILKALEVAKTLGHTEEDLVELKLKLAKINLENGESEKPIQELESLLILSKSKNRIKDIADTYGSLVVAYKKTGNINKAFEAQENYIIFNDSIVGLSQQKFLKDAEVKYETQAKELKIQKNIVEIAKKNNQIIIASIVALSFLLLGFLVYKNQKTKNQQQQQESALKEALLKIEAENQLQEQRLGISKELHDNIGSQLTFVISAIDTLKQNYPSTNEKIDSQLENINAFTKNTITELRDTVWVMNTKDIDANALKERLLENIERAKLSHNNIDFKVNIDNFEIENSGVALNLFRTIQEAVNNALKYAKASEIEISIHEKENKILALVADNGLGFDLETIKKGNGLKNMRKRIQTINGTFNIESSENLGTKINISIPQNS